MAEASTQSAPPAAAKSNAFFSSSRPFAVYSDVHAAMDAVRGLSAEFASSRSGSAASRAMMAMQSGSLHISMPRNALTSFDRSASARESFVYGYEPCISQWDRIYLSNRDPTIRLITEGQALDAVASLPTCLDASPSGQAVADAMITLDDLGLGNSLSTALAFALRDGFSFLYVDAPGELAGPIPPATPGSANSVITPNGFGVITAEMLVWPDPALYVEPGTAETRDPLLRHGILSLAVDFSRPPTFDWTSSQSQPPQTQHSPVVAASRPASTPNQQVEVHGHRIFPIVPDMFAKSFAASRSIIDVVYDDLRNLRDTLFAQSAAQLQGDPIILEVDVKEGFRMDDLDEERIAGMVRKFVDGQSDVFSPAEGLILKRMGPVKLQDMEPLVRATASRLSHAVALPVNTILASSRGSEQATPEDRNDYETRLTRRYRRPRLDPAVRHCLRVMGRGGSLSRRAAAAIPALHWPDTRVVAPDTAALIRKNEGVTLANALKAGRTPPRDILDRFPPNTVPIDPMFVLGSRRLPFQILPDGTPIPEPIVQVSEEVDPASPIVRGDEVEDDLELEERVAKRRPQPKVPE